MGTHLPGPLPLAEREFCGRELLGTVAPGTGRLEAYATVKGVTFFLSRRRCI